MSERTRGVADEMIGTSSAVRAVQRSLTRIARWDASVLIEGETGTGKEVAARAIHYGSARAEGPFVPVNCGAIPDGLFESELFGHSRGAFTDAKQSAPGILSLAEGGSLFLDEVDSLSLKAQVSLLRFLQDRKFRRVGEGQLRSSNVRVLAASNRSLEQLVAASCFRADLFYRLNVMHVALPALRERGDDVVMLARHFIEQHCSRHQLPRIELDRESEAWLREQPWPGNIRQLENLIEREVLLSDKPDVIRLSTVTVESEEPRTAQLTVDWHYGRAKARLLDQFNRSFLTELMQVSNGNVSLAARACGKERRDLGRLLQKYAIGPQQDFADESIAE
jgi:DNA-binding NtrC family response regulator